nr:MAG TPA: hypothetical protein [Caudoviricetes sp.]
MSSARLIAAIIRSINSCLVISSYLHRFLPHDNMAKSAQNPHLTLTLSRPAARARAPRRPVLD